MNKSRYCVIDCEMGGKGIQYSLLTSYFLIINNNFEKIDDLYLYVCPDDRDYFINGQGMSVNQINLIDHNKIAIPYKEAKSILYNFLKKSSDDGKCKLIPIGHGIVGDIKHITDKLISPGSWEQFCTYHHIDTSVVLQYLRDIGKMPMDCDGSVETLAKYFKVDKGEYNHYHDALFDAEMTMRVYQKMIELGKK